MKRARSALTLRNMAQSIQQSIQQTVKLQLARQTGSAHTRSTVQLPNGLLQDHELSKQQKDNRIFILEKQIACMERQLQNSKSTIRNYSKQLDDYELLTDRMTNTQQAINQKQEQLQRLRNQMLMIQEERDSIDFNTQQRIAEKQYYEQLVDTYKAQYDTQSKMLMAILQLEDSNKKVNQQIEQINRTIDRYKQELEKWRKQTEFDLNQHKTKNSIKIIRMELIAHQDKCDSFCQQHGLRKLRELYCLFFKTYAKRNGVNNEQAEGGIDLFICKQGLVQQFSEFVQERIIYNKPHFQSIQDYLLGLGKMEQIFKNSNSQINNKLYSVQLQQIKTLQAQVESKQCLLKNNQDKIVQLQSKIDQQFGQDSLAVIEYLRERSNKYDIQEIKATLKEHKKQQHLRLNKIREARSVILHLEQVLAKEDNFHQKQAIMQSGVELEEEAFSHQTQLQKLQHKLQEISLEKGNLESLINGAISKWRERDQNKIKLKQLYLQLAQAKKSHPKAATYNRSISFKQFQNTKKQQLKQCVPSQYALTDSRKTGHHSKNSSIVSLNQSKSILSLSNPYEKIMKRQIQQYQPIISDCRMIFSKKLPSRQESKQLLLAREEPKGLTISELKQSRAESTNMKKTKNTSQKAKGKENQLWQTRTKCQSQTQAQYSLSMKPSATISVQASKGKMTNSERASLSKLLISKFNR